LPAGQDDPRRVGWPPSHEDEVCCHRNYVQHAFDVQATHTVVACAKARNAFSFKASRPD